MSFIEDNFGRLGNRMFQLAFCHAYARDFRIDHFFQNTKRFARYADEIKAMFSAGIVFNDRVSIHIRRGDANHALYADLTQTDYYQRAIALFPGQVFLVFSDEPLFADMFLDRVSPTTVFEHVHGTAEEDLLRMAGCAHNIIANSTFSWWAAYLNPNPNKRVVCPSLWYAPGVKSNRPDYQKGWIEI